MTSDTRVPEPSALPEAAESLRQRVYEAVGEASTCWENLAGAGVFDDTRAREVAEALLRDIKDVTGWDQPKLGLASTAELRQELKVREELREKYGVSDERDAPSRPLWHLVNEPWVGNESLWRHRDFPSIFSTDRGETYYNLNEPLDPDGNPRIHRIGDQIA